MRRGSPVVRTSLPAAIARAIAGLPPSGAVGHLAWPLSLVAPLVCIACGRVAFEPKLAWRARCQCPAF